MMTHHSSGRSRYSFGPSAAVAVAAAALLLLATACQPARRPAAATGSSVDTVTPAAPDPVTVPLTETASPSRLLATIEIGGTPVTVLVDTGSVGLLVKATVLPAGAATPIAAAPPEAIADVQLTGTLARASVRVGPLTTHTPIPVELVTGGTCLPDRSSCRPSEAVTLFGPYGGILGIGTRSGRALTNPLWSLGPIGHTYLIHASPAAPALVLGAPAAGFVLNPLHPVAASGVAPTSGGDLPRSWRAVIPICVSADGLPASPRCQTDIIDTGDPSLASLHAPPPTRSLPPERTVTISASDHRWATTEVTARHSSIDLWPTPPGASSDGVIGLPVLAHLDIRYDLDAGTIGLRPHN